MKKYFVFTFFVAVLMMSSKAFVYAETLCPNGRTLTSNCLALANVSSVTQPSIEVVYPNGGESLVKGSQYTITWKKNPAIGSYVRIALLKGSTFVGYISAATANTGSFSWKVPANLWLGADYKIRVLNANLRIFDSSDSSFSIVSSPVPPLTVSNDIFTTSKAVVGQPATFSAVANGGTGRYTYSWTGACTGTMATCVKSFTTTGAKTATVTVTSGTLTASATITIDVTLLPPTLIPYFTIVTPVRGENWAAGSRHNITWNKLDGSGTYVNIDLLKGGVFYRNIAYTANTGSFVWNIPANLTLGSDYQIKVANSTNQNNMYGVSEANFNIIPLSSTLTVSTSVSSNTVSAGQPATFSAVANGGTGRYTYSWTGACTGTMATCMKSFTTTGAKTATVTVTSGTQSFSSSSSVNVTSAVQPSTANITLKSPNGGERFVAGSTYNIVWDKTLNSGAYVNIILYKGSYPYRYNRGSSYSNISRFVSNNGLYRWTLSEGYYDDGSDYRVKIVSVNENGVLNNNISDFSDAYFSIASPTLTIAGFTSPNSVTIGQPVAFGVDIVGGVRPYKWSWTGACTGTTPRCVKTFTTTGMKTATVTVTSDVRAAGITVASGNLSASTNVSVNVTAPLSSAVFDAVGYQSNQGDLMENPISSSCIVLTDNIQYRDNDILNAGAISKLQKFLKEQGFLSSEPSGYFGDQTFVAVKAFQAVNGIETTGYVGTQTRAKIRELNCD